MLGIKWISMRGLIILSESNAQAPKLPEVDLDRHEVQIITSSGAEKNPPQTKSVGFGGICAIFLNIFIKKFAHL